MPKHVGNAPIILYKDGAFGWCNQQCTFNPFTQSLNVTGYCLTEESCPSTINMASSCDWMHTHIAVIERNNSSHCSVCQEIDVGASSSILDDSLFNLG